MTGLRISPTVLYCGPTDVTPDERCFNLSELNLLSPDRASKRRYQILVLYRDDALVNVRIDLGLASSFTAPEFRVLGGVVDEATGRLEILHSVGELREIAEHQRAGLMWQPQIEPTDLLRRYHDQRDTNRRRRRGLSQFGPPHRV